VFPCYTHFPPWLPPPPCLSDWARRGEVTSSPEPAGPHCPLSRIQSLLMNQSRVGASSSLSFCLRADIGTFPREALPLPFLPFFCFLLEIPRMESLAVHIADSAHLVVQGDPPSTFTSFICRLKGTLAKFCKVSPAFPYFLLSHDSLHSLSEHSSLIKVGATCRHRIFSFFYPARTCFKTPFLFSRHVLVEHPVRWRLPFFSNYPNPFTNLL